MKIKSSHYYLTRAKKAPKYIIIIVLCCIFLLPFVVMVTTSFKTMSDAFTLPVSILPREFTLENYPAAMNRIPFFKYMGNTTFITLCSLLGQLTVTPMVAYSLAKIKWKGVGIISGLLMATMMIPYTVTMIPLYKIWHELNLTSTYIPLIAPAFLGNSFYIIIMRQFFVGIPNSLMEAAKIDGANEWTRYYKIALPLCKPALTTVGIYTFLAAWSDYLAPLIYITEKDRLTLSLGLQQFLNEFSVDWTMLMAAAAVFVLPVLVLFLVFQRNFVEGIATAGIKA
ncbi:MAG: carbohydrate ABC transporter permease [Oscillospiraceae bacterium]